MIEVLGYNVACAEVAARAMAEYDPTFAVRAIATEFWGLYDPEPCGAVIFEGNVMHVASLRPCGFSVRRLVRHALRTRPIVFAPIAHSNARACRLAEGMGFQVGIQADGINLYWRTP